MKSRIASLTLFCLAMAALPAMASTIYENGPINGTVDAWTINFGWVIGDTFTVSGGNSTITGLSFGAWVFPGDTLTSVQVALTSEPDDGGISYFDQTVNFTASGCFVNQYGFDVCTETGSFNGPSLSNGTYWLDLQNAIVPSGDPVYWDENSGIRCHSPGCPSQTWIAEGTIPSEAFTIEGNSNGTTPEPSSITLLGSGILGLTVLLRRKLL